MDSSREQWSNNLDPADHAKALGTMINRYLSRDHRDHPEEGCPLPALAADMALHREDTAETVEACARSSIEGTGRHIRELESGTSKEAEDLSIALLSLCVASSGASSLTSCARDDHRASGIVRQHAPLAHADFIKRLVV